MGDMGPVCDGPGHAYEVESSEPTSVVVVRAVSDVLGREPTDLPPIRERVDPDALDRLFDDTWGGASRSDGHVVFDYAGCTVTVLSGGQVLVNDSQDS